MRWNWQNEDWPRFRYEFAVFRVGQFQGVLKHVGPDDQSALTIQLLGQEAFKNAEIEGEMLDRDGLQSSLLRQFGLKSIDKKVPPPEQGMAELMVDLYRAYEKLLSDNLLFDWHRKIFRGTKNRIEVGHYRSSPDLMRVVSGSIHNPRIHLEAPPSERVARELVAMKALSRKGELKGTRYYLVL